MLENKDSPVDKDYGKEIYERENSCTIISFDELPKDLKKWFTKLYGKFFNKKNFLCSIKDHNGGFSVKIFTNDNEYSFYGYEKNESAPNGYLGGGVTSRKSHTGENWARGMDLPDGDYSPETFQDIIQSIVYYELKPIDIFKD